MNADNRAPGLSDRLSTDLVADALLQQRLEDEEITFDGDEWAITRAAAIGMTVELWLEALDTGRRAQVRLSIEWVGDAPLSWDALAAQRAAEH